MQLVHTYSVLVTGSCISFYMFRLRSKQIKIYFCGTSIAVLDTVNFGTFYREDSHVHVAVKQST